MFRFGQPELAALARVAASGQPFRYKKHSECERFEKRYGRYLGVRHVQLTSSGTTALVAALGGSGLGPGDEVIVPCHTYMATAIAVLAVGAIPVLADIDESLALAPAALADAIGPRTRAVIPVHMWGTVCDLAAIGRIARRKNLLVIEDACQCVGGSYRGHKVGAIGDAGAFSFNYFKNITCGEGGAVVTNDRRLFDRARCLTDCCSFFWNGRNRGEKPFAAAGARASEFEGAMLNAQLDRLDGMLGALRRRKRAVLQATAAVGLKPIPANSPEGECASMVAYQLATAQQAAQFAKLTGGAVVLNTGRHTYIHWHPILERRGAHHPALDPFRLPQNRGCRMTYRTDQFPRSLDILGRTVMIGLHPDRTKAEMKQLLARIRRAATAVQAR